MDIDQGGHEEGKVNDPNVVNSEDRKPVEIRVVDQEAFYEEFELFNQDIRGASDTIFVKKMNNFIKTLLINEVACRKRELSVLDLCCGVGGDLNKWQRVGTAHYVGSDLSSKSVEEAHGRHQQMVQRSRQANNFSAIFIVADASKDQSASHDAVLAELEKAKRFQRITFDVVSTQFAIHYMFEGERTLRGYLANVTQRLDVGGAFIGTTIDSDRLVSKIREAGAEKDLTIGNNLFSVVFGQDSFDRERGPFGLKYYFYLSDAVGKKQVADQKVKYVPEYLVQFDYLREIALEYGLKLEKKENFHEYYNKKMKEPCHCTSQSCTNMHEKEAQAYSRLFENMVKRNMPELDQESLDQQWEIVGLYCMFLFRKVGQRTSGRRGRANFGNHKLVRDIINQKSWE